MLELKPVKVGVEGQRDGRLVFMDDCLVAVLTHLETGDDGVAGIWFLEAGLGILSGPDQPIFPRLEDARDWIVRRLAQAASC